MDVTNRKIRSIRILDTPFCIKEEYPLEETASNVVKLGDYITKNEAEKGFREVIAAFEETLKAKGYLTVPMTQNEWNAIVSFSYNTGPGNSNPKSKLVGFIQSKDYVSAGYQLEKTIIGTKSKPTLLQSRRTKEANMWFKNNPGNPA